MRQYKKYLVKEADQFDPENFYAVTEEVMLIREKAGNLPSPFKSEILVSFLKDHSLRADWIEANPELTALVETGSLFTGQTESLFESSRHHPAFQQQLEKYLTESFSGTAPPIDPDHV